MDATVVVALDVAVVRVAASTACVEMAYVTPLAVNTIAVIGPASVCSCVRRMSGTLVVTTDPSMRYVTASAGAPGIEKRLVRTGAIATWRLKPSTSDVEGSDVVRRTGVRVRPEGMAVVPVRAVPPMRSTVPSRSVAFGVAPAVLAPESTETPTTALASRIDRSRDEGRRDSWDMGDMRSSFCWLGMTT